MNRKVKTVITLVFFLLVVADSLQVGWLYTNYRETEKQYARDINDALGESSTYYQVIRRLHTNQAIASMYLISDSEILQYTISKKGPKTKIEFLSDHLRVDSIGPGLGRTQLLQIKDRDQPFDKILFDSLFRINLLKRGVTASYLIDTMRTAQEKARKQPVTKVELIPSRAAAVAFNPDYPVHSSFLLLNNYDQLYVYTSVKKQSGYILKAMWAILIASFLIFVIVNAALLYVIKTIRQQKKMADIKNDFINNMTHELRTPVATATAAIDSLLNHHSLEDTTRIRSYLNISRNELLHLDGLVEKIMMLSLEDKLSVDLQYEYFSVQALLKTIVQNHLLTAVKQINFTIKEQADITLYADKFHLANSINNIVDNAVKYSGETVNISIGYTVHENSLILTISDNGIGIPEQYMEDIFHSFFRVPQGNRHEVKGFGLGLAYVKTMIEKHKGFIKVESELGRGTSFHLSIPIHHA